LRREESPGPDKVWDATAAPAATNAIAAGEGQSKRFGKQQAERQGIALARHDGEQVVHKKRSRRLLMQNLIRKILNSAKVRFVQPQERVQYNNL